MDSQNIREKVIARLVKGGFNRQSAESLTEGENYEYAIKYYTTPKKIADCILALI